MIQDIQLDNGQQHALNLMLEGHNVFLTGNAGVGKSVVIEKFKELCTWNVAVLAPTGLAAIKVGGSTIHRFFKLDIAPIMTSDILNSITPEIAEIVTSTDTFFIDEISMVGSDMFWAIDSILRSIVSSPDNQYPFGNKQIVVVGDFFQLEPISKLEVYRLTKFYGGIYAFDSPSWQGACFNNVILTEVHRQAGDLAFIEFLDTIRVGNYEADDSKLMAMISWFNQHVRIGEPPEDAISLCTTKDLAQAINDKKDALLPGVSSSFRAKVSGKFPEDSFPTDTNLELKLGSRVMLVRNLNTPEEALNYVNGDVGVVVDLCPEAPTVTVQLDSGRRVLVTPVMWENMVYEVTVNPETGGPKVSQKPVGWFTQVPIKKAFATTIHKSQGGTYDAAHIVLGNRGTFASGQAYTALSRCRSMSTLSIDRPLRLQDLKLDRRILQFYQIIKNQIDPLHKAWWDHGSLAQYGRHSWEMDGCIPRIY
jgi:hypothetical protein